MNRKISLMNPRYPYAFLFILIALCGFVLTKQQLTPGDLGHSVQMKDYTYALLLGLGTLLACGWISHLYLLPQKEWRRWAIEHKGSYSHPANLQLQPYGMVLDMLQGIDPKTGSSFVMARTIQVFRNYPASSRGLASRRFLILAEPNGSFSKDSRDGTDLIILASEQYHWNLPTLEHMVSLVKAA